MSYADNPYRSPMSGIAATASVDARASFITQTYIHLAGAVALFAALEAALLTSRVMEDLIPVMSTRFGWMVVLGLFMLVSYVANNWATSAVSPGMQYAGLGLYVAAEAIIFAPLMYVAEHVQQTTGQNIIGSAAITTLGLFAAMTAAVFITRKDFSFLRTFLVFGSFAAFGFIFVAMLFNFAIGPIFVYAMIALACGYILYDTSNVLHRYRIGQHVAASLALFASVALLFWYLVQFFMSRRN